MYRANRVESQLKQVAAHKSNHLLLRPPEGITVTKLTIVSEGRMERIIDWVRQYGNYQQLNIALSDILNRLVFGMNSDKFEQALDDLSRVLGFKGERPDKEWKEGPDNLWALDSTHYILWECKNEVVPKRLAINKREAEQMNRSCAWFEKTYLGGCRKKHHYPPNTSRRKGRSIYACRRRNARSRIKAISNSGKGILQVFRVYGFR